MAHLLKPGMDNKPSGTYVEVGPRGGKVTNARYKLGLRSDY